MLKKNQEILSQVKSILSDIQSPKDRIEILANMFIIEGVRLMFDSSTTEEEITIRNILPLVINHKKKHGETIGNALVLQGLLILEWLDRGE